MALRPRLSPGVLFFVTDVSAGAATVRLSEGLVKQRGWPTHHPRSQSYRELNRRPTDLLDATKSANGGS